MLWREPTPDSVLLCYPEYVEDDLKYFVHCVLGLGTLDTTMGDNKHFLWIRPTQRLVIKHHFFLQESKLQ